MALPRVIACLLLDGEGLIQTEKFRNETYIGDPINACRILRKKQVDEVSFIDINATVDGREPNYSLLESIAKESFMPLSYGGGIKNLEQIGRLHKIGYEKTIISSAALDSPELIDSASSKFGSQSIVVCIDVKYEDEGYEVYTERGNKRIGKTLSSVLPTIEDAGAGEIMINSIDKDGCMCGYDLELIESVSSEVDLPVVALGGASSLDDMRSALDSGASAAAAGSLFVFHGPHRAVLISYPDLEKKKKVIYE